MQLARAVLSSNVNDSSPPEVLRRTGVAALVALDFGTAAAWLRRAASAAPESAATWNDLAVALATQARHESSADLLVHALDAVVRARELDPRLQEPTVTEAHVLGELGTDVQLRTTREQEIDRLSAIAGADVLEPTALEGTPDLLVEVVERRQLAAWARALLDGHSARAVPLATRARTLSALVQRQGGDTSIVQLTAALTRKASGYPDAHRRARGWLAYLSAVDALESDDASAAERYLVPHLAVLSHMGSAVQARARLLAATIDRIQGRTARALRRVTSSTAMEAITFSALDGRRRWQRGLLLAEAGNIGGALTEFRQALSRLDAVGDREGAAVVSSLIASTHADMNDWDEAWRLQTRANRLLQYCRRIRREPVWTNAALMASDMGLYGAAAVFRTAAIDDALRAGSTVGLGFLLADSATDLEKRGRQQEATRVLHQAEALVRAAKDTGAREMLEALMTRTRAVVSATADPEQAQALFAHAIELYRGRGSEFATVDLALRRGLVLRVLRRDREAENAFLEGLRVGRQQERSIGGAAGAELRAARWELYRELAGILLDRGETWSAFRMIEEARHLSNAHRDAPAAEPRSAADRTVYVSYLQLRDRFIAWVLSSRERSTFVIHATPASVAAAVERHRAALRQGVIDGPDAEALYDLLVRPLEADLDIAETLTISADGPLLSLPFATLRDGAHATLVLDRAAVALVPSVPEGNDTPGGREGNRMTAVGDPSRLPVAGAMPRLPGARAEAREIAGLYPHSSLLLGSEATREAVSQLLRRSDIFHFAGHAVANSARPGHSRLLLAPAGDDVDGSLFASEIETMDVRVRLAILAACDTATGTALPGVGVMGLARAFMMAGVREVVATQWPVVDEDASKFFVQLHRELLKGRSTTEALWIAQRQARASGLPAAAWAAVVVMRKH